MMPKPLVFLPTIRSHLDHLTTRHALVPVSARMPGPDRTIRVGPHAGKKCWYRTALLKIRRVLKPGGLSCGTVPYRWYAEPHPMHFRVFFFSTEIKWLLKRYFVDVKVELIPNKRAEDRSTQIFWVARKLES